MSNLVTRSAGQRLQEKRDSIREDVRDRQRHTMLAERRATIERNIKERKNEPIDR